MGSFVILSFALCIIHCSWDRQCFKHLVLSLDSAIIDMLFLPALSIKQFTELLFVILHLFELLVCVSYYWIVIFMSKYILCSVKLLTTRQLGSSLVTVNVFLSMDRLVFNGDCFVVSVASCTHNMVAVTALEFHKCFFEIPTILRLEYWCMYFTFHF